MKIKNKKGVSLIVLSITILVMAILAATAIIALEDSGIIKRSKDTVKNNNYSDEYTRLVVIKNGILTDNLGTITVDEYITELTNKGLIESTIVSNSDGSKTVTTKTGFEIIISQNGTNDLNITIDGYTPPSSNTGNSSGDSGNSGNTGENDNTGDSGNSDVTTEYTLSGKWTFNDTLTQTGWASGTKVKHESINFYRVVDGATDSETLRASFDYYPAGTLDDKNATSASVDCEAILTNDMNIYMLYHFGTCANSTMHITPGAVNKAYKTIDFGSTPQAVSEEFYNWFTANATQEELVTKYIYSDLTYWTVTAYPSMTWQQIVDQGIKGQPYRNTTTELTFTIEDGKVITNTDVIAPVTGSIVLATDKFGDSLNFETSSSDKYLHSYNY